MRAGRFALDSVLAVIAAMILVGCTPPRPPAKTSCVYEAVEYTIDTPNGFGVVLRSRGTGHGTGESYFDIYISNPTSTPSTTAFLGDPVWFEYALSLQDALQQTSDTDGRVGNLPTADANYYLDFNGGSDMGGVTFQFGTGTLASSAQKAIQANHHSKLPRQMGSEPLWIDIEPGGDVFVDGTADAVNANGAFFWNGSKWVTNDTAAHAYFLRLINGERLKIHNVVAVGSAPGTQAEVYNLNGYRIVQGTYTYTVAKATGGGVANLGSSFPVKFSVQFTDNVGQVQELRLSPGLVSETEQ